MAEFVTVAKEFCRMCDSYASCNECQLRTMPGANCIHRIAENSEKAEKIIMKWSAEHPVETLKDRFFEMFPNAPKNGEGNPRICPSELGLTDPEYCDYNCEKCWSAEWKGAEN